MKCSFVKMMQLTSVFSLSAWSSQVNVLISEWCSLTSSLRQNLAADVRQITWHFVCVCVWGGINQRRSAVKKATPVGPLIAIFDFKESLSNLPRSSFPRWDPEWQPIVARTLPPPPPHTVFFMFQISSREFSQAQEMNLAREEEKRHLYHRSLSFHQISCRENC